MADGGRCLKHEHSRGRPHRRAGLVRPLTLITVSGVALSAALLPVATSAQLRLGAVDRWLPFGYAVLVAAGGFWTAYRRAGRTPDLIPFLGEVSWITAPALFTH